MIARFLKLFRVLPDEGAKLAPFVLFGALLQGGVAIGMTAADSLFLTYLGPGKLPVFFICMPPIMAAYALVYSALLARFGIDRLVRLTLMLLIAGGVFFGLSGSLFGEGTPWLLFAMKFYVGLWFIALYTLFWNFVDDYFSILEGKRLYGIIAAGVGVGAMCGAGLVTGLSQLVAPGQLFFAWAIAAALTLPVFATLRRRFPKIEADTLPTSEVESATSQLKAAFSTLGKSRFAIGLAAACFCAANLASLLEYLSMGVFSRDKSPADLAQLLGQLYVVANILTLLVNLFGYSRLVTRFGAGNTALVLPIVFATASAAFFLHGGFAAALIAFYAYQTLLPGVEYNNMNVLYNALPASAKRSVRTFVEAMGEPLATALAGAFLLAWADRLGTAYVALAGVLVALAGLLFAFVLRHRYQAALADNLRHDWLDFSPAADYWQKQLTPADRTLLREKALCSSDRAERIAATSLLGYTADAEASNAVTELVSTARPAEAELLRPSIARILRSGDTATIAELMLWLESEHSPEDPELLDEFVAHGALSVRQLPSWSRSRHPARIAMSAIARWHGPRMDDAGRALTDVHALLSGDAIDRRWGVRALGSFRHPQYARELLPLLEEPDGELRLEVLRALNKLANPDGELVLKRVLPLLNDATQDERQLILGIAEKVGAVGPVADLLLAAGRFPASDNRQLETMLASFGPRAIATVTHVLRNPVASTRSRVVAARTLARIAKPQLDLISGDLLVAELERALQCARWAAALAPEVGQPDRDGIAVLRRFYHDSAVDGLDFAIQLLGFTDRLPDVDLIRASVTSANAKDRANAIEAIEQSCSHALFQKFEPLLAATAECGTEGPLDTTPESNRDGILRRAAVSNNAIECAAAMLVLGDSDPNQARSLVQKRIAVAGADAPYEAATFAAMLPTFDSKNRGRGRIGLNPVERIAAFVSAPYFDGARIDALEYLATRSTEKRAPDGAVLYSPRLPTGNLVVVVDGNVEVSHNGVTRQIGRGGTCNERSLMGTILSEEQAVSKGCTVLLIPCSTVARAIETFPALGISLYRTKIVGGPS